MFLSATNALPLPHCNVVQPVELYGRQRLELFLMTHVHLVSGYVIVFGLFWKISPRTHPHSSWEIIDRFYEALERMCTIEMELYIL